MSPKKYSKKRHFGGNIIGSKKVQKIIRYDGDPNDLTPEQLKYLEDLDCSNMDLTRLPKGMVNLEYLSCENNNLTSLPSGMVNLEYLSCENNNLTSLPLDMINLEELVCYNNLMPVEFEESPDRVEKYHQLRKDKQTILTLLTSNNKKGTRMVLNNNLIRDLKNMLY